MHVNGMALKLDITPVPKPRQTRADKWKKRPAVLRYRAFADEIRYKVGTMDLNHTSITFGLPMPASWSQKKKEAMKDQPHTQRPDISNLLKALEDAIYATSEADDCEIHSLDKVHKRWSDKGYILIEIGDG